MQREPPESYLYPCALRNSGRMCKLSVSGTTCAPPARRKGVTPGKSPGHNRKEH
nr:MAG TPA: hypothetical protein [Caudoviricetes sp.]